MPFKTSVKIHARIMFNTERSKFLLLYHYIPLLVIFDFGKNSDRQSLKAHPNDTF